MRESASERNPAEFTTYTDERHGYSVAYPTDWSAEIDPSGVAFDAPGPESAGAEVFVDDVHTTLSVYVASFLDELVADKHVHALQQFDGHDVWLGGRRGHVVKCAYVGDDPEERWRLSYLFVLAGETGYTVGVDWETSSDGDFERTAARIIESFTLDGATMGQANGTNTATGDRSGWNQSN